MNILLNLKRYFHNLFYNQTEESEFIYDTGNKRPNDENQLVPSKRRKTLSDSDAGILSIDLTETPESSSDSTSPVIMPRSKRKKEKQNGSKIKDNHDVIEIDDDNDESSTAAIDLDADDVEIVDSPARNLRSKALASPSFHLEMAKARSLSKVENSQKPSGSKFQIPSASQSYLTFSSVLSPQPILRSTRSNSFHSRTLKELNNKSSVSNGYPSEVYKKDASVTSPTANRPIARQFNDKLIIDKVKKFKNTQAVLDLVKEYANSPEAKQQSPSYRSLGSSLKLSSSSSGSRQSTCTFGTFDTKQLDFSSDLKKSNSLMALPSTRLQTLHLGTSPVGSLTKPSASSNLNFDTTVRRPSASPSSSKPNFTNFLRRLSASPSSSKHNKSAVNKTVIDLTSEEDD